jgi:hypothetical protein
MTQKQIPEDRLIDLSNKLDLLPKRSSETSRIIQEFADLYGVSKSTIYRRLRKRKKPKSLKRSDYGVPRVAQKAEMERFCKIIAAMKIRTRNKKGHHLPTSEAIRLIENYGIETPEDGLVKAPKSLLKKATVNRYLKKWGYDFTKLTIQPPAVRFQAKHTNECWQFDLSPSDLKVIEKWPEWMDQKKGRPLLMLYSVVDDRSGVIYQEYHCVYGEDVEAALRFLYHAMAPKEIEGFPFQGIPQMIYTDNGPIAKSHVFQRVMQYLGIEIRRHMPSGKDGRRVTARAKGKVERPFRTVKNVHETLFRFHKPKSVEEANKWLLNYVLRYNEDDHRSESHSRIEDWIENLPPNGIREMCAWERYSTFAREPQRRKVGGDARIRVNGVAYQVDPNLAEQEVILWWGVFDSELYVEFGDQRFGPYRPVGGAIPLNRYRTFKKTAAEKRADQVETLAKKLHLPIEALSQDSRLPEALLRNLPENTRLRAFDDPDPFQNIRYPNILTAKRAIADYLGIPLARLQPELLVKIDAILSETLNKAKVIEDIRIHLKPHFKGR